MKNRINKIALMTLLSSTFLSNISLGSNYIQENVQEKALETSTQSIQNVNPHNTIKENEVINFKNEPHSLNVMWINKEHPEKLSDFFYDQQGQSDKFNNYLNNVKGWVEKGYQVNFWYDGDMVGRSGVKQLEKKFPTVTFINIQDLDFLTKDEGVNQNLFDSTLPTYFRIDLLKAIISYEKISKDPESSFIFADLDMPAISKEEMFDPITNTTLTQFGTVMANVGNTPETFENGFFILSGHNKNLLNAMKIALIDVNIERAKLAHKQGFYNNSDNRTELKVFSPLTQRVYDSYRYMFKLFYHMQGWGELVVKSSRVNKLQAGPYDYKIHGLVPFGINHWNNNGFDFNILNPLITYTNQVFGFDQELYPVKQGIDLISSHKYND